MICPDCGREIADNSITCQYCGKLFVSQRARAEQMPAQDQINHLSGQLASQEMATSKAIGFRRKQRWFFYGVLVLMFVGALVLVINIYNSNSKAMADLANVQVRYASKEKQLEELQKQLDDLGASLNDKSLSVTDYQDKLLKATKSLTEVTEKNKKLEDDLTVAKARIGNLDSEFAGMKSLASNLLNRLSLSVTESELIKVPIALSNADVPDTDKDTLPDELEQVIGTDSLKMDTDADGFDDRAELESGFNPKGEGKWATAPMMNYKNRLLATKNGAVSYVWYVAENGKRYYLGASDNDFEYLRKSAYWTGL